MTRRSNRDNAFDARGGVSRRDFVVGVSAALALPSVSAAPLNAKLRSATGPLSQKRSSGPSFGSQRLLRLRPRLDQHQQTPTLSTIQSSAQQQSLTLRPSPDS